VYSVPNGTSVPELSSLVCPSVFSKGLLKVLLYLIHYNYEGVKYYIHAKTKEASAQTKY
jgi:hypothetical protein